MPIQCRLVEGRFLLTSLEELAELGSLDALHVDHVEANRLETLSAELHCIWSPPNKEVAMLEGESLQPCLMLAHNLGFTDPDHEELAIMVEVCSGQNVEIIVGHKLG